jgi:enoyl-CoA hydratase/carnithine racemase
MSIKTATLNGVATIEIARPEKKNALTVAMYQAMADALNAAQADPAVRAVLITGQPGIFTSGQRHRGLHEPAAGSGSNSAESPVFQFMRALVGIDKPVVAAVTGAAIGIGTTMLLHCDRLRVRRSAAGHALRQPRPGAGVRLQPHRAEAAGQREGRREAAARRSVLARGCGGRAHRQRRAARRRVVNHARRIAERFNGAPGAVRETKKLLRRTSTDEILKTIAIEGELFGARLRSPEAMEAFQAFFQKRKPDFSKFS